MILKSQNVKMMGVLSIKKFNSKQELIQEITIPNLVVTSGKEYIADRMVSGSSTIMSHMAVGNNNTVPTLTNTALLSELGRVALDNATRAGSIITYTATFGPAVATGSITEAGIFNASSSGTMLCRTTFPVISKASTETIAITWNVSVG